jgi:polar amino acid transport system substrate-binding protein
MRLFKFFGALLALGLGMSGAEADEVVVKSVLAPTGKLRLAIAAGPTAGVLFASKDGATGQYRGASVSLGRALAKKLDVPIELVPYANSGQIVAAVNSGAWDVTFMPVDEERRKTLAFGSPYCLLQSTYLVAPEAKITALSDVDRAEVRIVGIDGTATIRASMRVSPSATHIAAPGPAEAVELVRGGKADAMAFGREELIAIASKLPGSRVLDGGFLNTTLAIAVSKEKAAALAYISAFVDEAIASGLVRRAFDEVGAGTSVVAPVGTKP